MADELVRPRDILSDMYLVDAFTSGPFTGNPAGVCPLVGPADARWMQNVAMEMNQAETAFVWPEGADWRLRWFTPAVEVDLCGHATLACAHVLWESGRLISDARFQTRSGLLVCRRVEDEISMDFPARPLVAAAPPSEFPAFGQVLWSGHNGMDWMIEVAEESVLRAAQPDFAAIARAGLRGLIVTTKGKDTDFVSRFFAPQSGVPEDPVTGSAHCALAPYWSAKLQKTELVGYQASTRGGIVKVAVLGDRVELRGRARTVLSGELFV